MAVCACIDIHKRGVGEAGAEGGGYQPGDIRKLMQRFFPVHEFRKITKT